MLVFFVLSDILLAHILMFSGSLLPNFKVLMNQLGIYENADSDAESMEWHSMFSVSDMLLGNVETVSPQIIL